MSDFDKFFAEKLDEEGQFPRRDRNWRALSKRLDAFNTGLQQQVGNTHRYLRYWQAAAACTVITAGFLIWKVDSVQNENAGLRKEVALWQEKYKAVSPQAAAESIPNNKEAIGDQPHPAASAEPAEFLNSPKDNARNRDGHIGNSRKTEVKSHTQSQGVSTGYSATNEVVANNSGISNSVVSEENPPSGEPLDLPDSKALEKAFGSIMPTLQMIPTDSLHAVVLIPQEKVLSLPQPTPHAEVAPPEIIKPVSSPSRFRAGIQIMAGLPIPDEKGVSFITGNGITAEYNVWRNFWLTGSADWLRYDISTEKYFPKFHSHHNHPPLPNNPQQEILVKVESTQRQQQYGLGLRYALPVRTWLRPSVRVAYALTRVSPELITFKFENHGPWGPGGPGGPWGPWGPPPPIYKVQKTESQVLDNIWRFGAGLEHETPRWAFSLWADYSKNFAATDLTFDALMLRAGIQYTFN